MVKLFKSRFIKPYNNDKSTNLGFCKGKAGVYLIKDNNTGKVVYIGYSATNLYKTVLRHFQSWDDKRQVRVFYGNKHDYSVRIVITTPARAEKLEAALIVTYKPKDNPDKMKKYSLSKYEFGIMDDFENSEIKTVVQMAECPF